MATEILTGKAVVNGISNSGSAISISGYATAIINALNVTDQVEIEEVKDELGFDAALVARNRRYRLTMDFTPAGSSRSAAAALATFPTPLSVVTISNCLISAYNGAWIYTGGAQVQSQNGQIAKVTGMELVRYADSTQHSSLSTLVSS